MPPKIDDILMSETTRILLNLGSSLLLALATGVLGWMFRGKRESQKIQIEIEQLEIARDREEKKWRRELMDTVYELERKVMELQKTVKLQHEELESLKELIAEKDEQIKKLTDESKLVISLIDVSFGIESRMLLCSSH